MIEKTDVTNAPPSTLLDSNLDQNDQIFRYQISELHKEIEYLNRRLSLIPNSLQILCKKMHELWWTLTSLVGFGWLHDGTRFKPSESSSNSTIALPIISPDSMPSPRLFLDATATYKSKYNTGVQRVIRELCRHGEKNGALSPIIIHNNQFVTLPDLAPLIFQSGDKILLLDSGWTITNIYPPALETAKLQGAEIILGIHDLIPYQYPGFVYPYFSFLFEEWLNTVAPYCTAVLAVSRYSADCFMNWSQKRSNLKNISSIGWFHLGANIPEAANINESDPLPNICVTHDYFLSVGTIEPRKGYSVSLDAFDHIWREGSSLNYVIIGRQGDLGAHITNRILNHPQFNKMLFWPQNVDDRMLAAYYAKCIGLIIPALAEGFGLPLIEASFYQKPIIASDLIVFKEIAPNLVSFFPPTDSYQLALMIKQINKNNTQGTINNNMSWDKAASNMTNIIKSKEYQIKIIN